MLWFALIFGAVAGAVGWFLHHRGILVNFTVSILSGLLVASIVGPATWGIGTTIMKNDEQTFQEFWGGYEAATSLSTQPCERDGSCQNEYHCDPYTYTWVETYTDGDGKTQTRVRSETRYHDCPYSTEETSYTISTTLGDYHVGTFMTGPQYRGDRSIPGGQVTEPPAVWSAAKARIDAGEPGGVFKQNSYKNYLLASESSILKHYSADIDEYKAEGLLMPISKDLHNIYQMEKSQFLGGPKLDDEQRKQLSQDAMYLSAALGSELQGDLRVVFLDENDVPSSEAERYGLTLMAYWQSAEMGKFALPKNAVVVIVGVGTEDGKPTAEWTRAFTGMPVGNERLATAIESTLTGEVIDENFLGHPVLLPGSERVTKTDGLLEDALFGPNKFARISMDAVDEDDIGSGFEYLGAGWEPDDGQQTLLYVLATVFSLLLLVPFGFWAAYTPTMSVRGRYGYGSYSPQPLGWMDPLAELNRRWHAKH
jgi:hypothetical protein